MNGFGPILKYEFLNVVRGRWVLAYALLFAALSEGLLQFGTDSLKAVASLANVVLLVIPMVSILYSAITWYSSESFTLLLLTQPTKRWQIYFCRWTAISVGLSLGYVVGTAIPLLASHSLGAPGVLMLGLGVALTFIFSALGLLTSVLVQDRMKGIGAAFLLWFYFAIVHDSVVFAVLSAFHDYPLETPAMILTGINPIDLARVTLLLSLDLSALMGYTGRILETTLSTSLGYVLIALTLSVWIGATAWAGVLVFETRDF